MSPEEQVPNTDSEELVYPDGTPPKESGPNIFLLLAAGFILIVVSGAIIVVTYMESGTSVADETSAEIEEEEVASIKVPYNPVKQNDFFVIEKKNLFGNADALLLSGSLEEARAEYESFMADSGLVAFKSALEFRLALTESDPVARVKALKAIADIDYYSDDVRARSVEAMGITYMRTTDENVKKAITDVIFNTRPYVAFNNENADAAYAALFEYAASLDAVQLGNAYAASYYMSLAIAEAQKDNASQELIESYALRTSLKLQNIEAERQKLKEPIISAYINDLDEQVIQIEERLVDLQTQ